MTDNVLLSESERTRRICRDLEQLGAYTYPLIGSTHAKPGWPDRLIVHPYWSGLVEFKLPHGKLGELQWFTLKRLSVAWFGHVVVAYHGNSLLWPHDERRVTWDGSAKSFLELVRC